MDSVAIFADLLLNLAGFFHCYIWKFSPRC